MLPKIVLVKSSEVKGIMKKTTSTNSTTLSTITLEEDSTTPSELEKPKSSGRLISWNEKLFDVRYFEVEPSNNMTKSTSRLRQEVHQKVSVMKIRIMFMIDSFFNRKLCSQPVNGESK